MLNARIGAAMPIARLPITIAAYEGARTTDRQASRRSWVIRIHRGPWPVTDLPLVLNLVNNMVMIQVNVFEVKAKLSEYLDRAARGERIIICRHNKPVAELRAVEQVRREPRPIGPLPGRPQFDVPPSFFEPLSEEELDLWDGTANDPLLNPPLSPARSATTIAESKPNRRSSRTSRRRT